MNALASSSLVQVISKVLSPCNLSEDAWLKQVCRLFQTLYKYEQSRQLCISNLQKQAQKYVSAGNKSYNRLMLSAAVLELYKYVMSIKQPNLGFIVFKLKQKRKVSGVEHRSKQLFEESKERSKRKKEREYQRLLREISDQNQREGKIVQKNSEKSQKLTPTKIPRVKTEHSDTYSSRHNNKRVNCNQSSGRTNDHPKSKDPRLLFELNIKVND